MKDSSAKKAYALNTLISKLMSYEKDTFNEATSAQMQEMLSDKKVQALLNSVAADAKTSGAQIRQERRGLLLLRREIFYQAVQVNVSDSQFLTKRVKYTTKMLRHLQNLNAKQKVERAESEQKFYDYALQMAEKMLFQDDILTDGKKVRKTIESDPNVTSLLKGSKRLGIFKNLEGFQDKSIDFWSQWDLRAARIFNQSLGPENSFEEQIQWTEDGKQWPYPIDNEYMFGSEAEVPFYEHIFLERHLPGLGIPKDGPIAHFMELVCVGLSKNPYMTAAKKMEHLQWFANFFNKEKQALIEKLHQEEQLASQHS
ncbi:unnamed protein product [Angiostrongylus costaricensis]|uniref:Small ribosomal subunit protein mS31 n=1 Tax=Angiostrongylus costaricensis TaxID=334426 RepID=A0A158PIZ3_ANGCS|nr:unnamed protein product [Angiostrongylus costaricensis]